MKMKLVIGLALLCTTGGISAQYQGPISAPCVVQPNLSCTPVTSSNPLPVASSSGSGGGGATTDSYVAPAPIPATAGSAYTVQLGKGQGTVAFAITGLTASGATLSAQYSDDNGANYYPLRNIGTATVPGTTTFTTDGPISFTGAGHTQLRLIVTTAGTGNITIGSNASVPARGVNLEGAGTAATNPFYVTAGAGSTLATAANQNSTAAGTSATNAQGIQGVTGGVAVPISSAQEATIAANQTNGNQMIQGNIASGVTDAGNPVKIGARVSSLGDNQKNTGQRIDLAATNWGALYVSTTAPMTSTADGYGSIAVIQARNTDNQFGPLLTVNSYWTGSQTVAARADAAGNAFVTSKGSATIATGQVSVGTTATLIRAADPGRSSITVIVGAANGCAFGNSGVTTTTGYLLPATAGATDKTDTSAALYGVCTAATTVSYKVILP